MSWKKSTLPLSVPHYWCVQAPWIKILFPVIDAVWKMNKDEVEFLFENEGISLCGDGRCDSPGHCAKHGTYSLMEERSGLILHFELVQIGECAANEYGSEIDEIRKSRTLIHAKS